MLRQAVGQEPATAGLRRCLRAAATATRLTRVSRLRSGDRAAYPLHHRNRQPQPKEGIMQNSSEFQYIAIDQLFESKTNPRKTFDQKKLEELADFVPGNKIGLLWR